MIATDPTIRHHLDRLHDLEERLEEIEREIESLRRGKPKADAPSPLEAPREASEVGAASGSDADPDANTKSQED